MGSSSLTVFLI